jgi:RimJ/RimL family protein N-acetyltransferase
MRISLRLITSNLELEEIKGIYINSFPANERREFNELEKQLEKSDNQIFQVRLKQITIGFISLWNFDDFVFVEHIAISSSQRGKGYGKMVVQAVMDTTSKPIVLEVEPPVDEDSIRRVRFYSSLGFSILPQVYMQPSYDGVKPSVELKLMTNYNLPTDIWVMSCIRIIIASVYSL